MNQIAKDLDETQGKIRDIVQMTFQAILDTLIQEGRIELRNFGVFEIKRRKARRARNPRTDEPVMVNPKNVITFQAGKNVEKLVQRAQVHVPKSRKKSPKKVVKKTNSGKNSK